MGSLWHSYYFIYLPIFISIHRGKLCGNKAIILSVVRKYYACDSSFLLISTHLSAERPDHAGSAQMHEGQLSFESLSVSQSILKLDLPFIGFDRGQGLTIHSWFVSPLWYSHVSLFSRCHPQSTVPKALHLFHFHLHHLSQLPPRYPNQIVFPLSDALFSMIFIWFDLCKSFIRCAKAH